jgi:hypothetical protein
MRATGRGTAVRRAVDGLEPATTGGPERLAVTASVGGSDGG